MQTIHPLHAFLVAGGLALFLGALVNDLVYVQTYEIQWKNFATWLIVGALVLSGLALLWGLVERFGRGIRPPRAGAYVVLLLIAWVLGFINAFVHAADAWASMPQGLILTVLVVILLTVATALRFARLPARAIT